MPEDLVLAARREEIEWVHSDGVYEIVPMQECIDSGQKLLDLIWVDTDKSVDPAYKQFDRGYAQESTRRRSKATCSEHYRLLSYSLQCRHLNL